MSDDRLVVGHDGSAGADTALTTALGLAETLQSLVEVIRAWSVATAPRPANWTFGYVSSSEDLQGAVLDVLVTDVADIVSRHAGVAVSYRAVNGDAAASLIELSGTARMVVVGSRGLGGVAEMLLGSVSDEVVRRAHCPVLVTKGPVKR